MCRADWQQIIMRKEIRLGRRKANDPVTSRQ